MLTLGITDGVAIAMGDKVEKDGVVSDCPHATKSKCIAKKIIPRKIFFMLTHSLNNLENLAYEFILSRVDLQASDFSN